jgi:hypothetical protein
MDGNVNFFRWGYTTPPGSTFNNHQVDYDGDHFIPQQDMSFGFYDTFLYRDTTGANPDEDIDTTFNFQPVVLSDARGWCGFPTHPLALEAMGGQVTFDFGFAAFLSDEDLIPNGGALQIVSGFEMRSYGSLELDVNVNGLDILYSASAVMNNTDPALGRDASHPWGYADPAYYNHVSFVGGGVIPSGAWVIQGPGGAWDLTVVPAGTPGAVWHNNSFAGFPFMLRADATREVLSFDESFYGPAPEIIPEPSSIVLTGSVLAGLAGVVRRKVRRDG